MRRLTAMLIIMSGCGPGYGLRLSAGPTFTGEDTRVEVRLTASMNGEIAGANQVTLPAQLGWRKGLIGDVGLEYTRLLSRWTLRAGGIYEVAQRADDERPVYLGPAVAALFAIRHADHAVRKESIMASLAGVGAHEMPEVSVEDRIACGIELSPRWLVSDLDHEDHAHFVGAVCQLDRYER